MYDWGEKMERRPYGTTGIDLSILGFGGILVMDCGRKEASRIVAKSVDCGINYFDVAPSYGNAEERLGPALEPYRKEVFLACKTGERSWKRAEDELMQSLKNMKTDYFDLYQLHAMTTREDVKQAVAPDGIIPFLIDAKNKGIVRHIGFSAHSVEVAIELLDLFDFDSVLFPLNWTHYFQADFGPQIVEKAVKKKVAVLALKALAFGKILDGEKKAFPKCWYIPIEDSELADLALRFTLSQKITAAIPPGEEKSFDMAMAIASNFKPINDREIDYLKEKSCEAVPMFNLEGQA